MKVSAISILILLTAFIGLNPVLGQPQDANQIQQTKQEEPVKETEHIKTTDANSIADTNVTANTNKINDANATADVNIIADVNVAADPNAVRTEIEKFEGLSELLSSLNTKSGNEINEWTRGRLDDRLDLALAMQSQITAELKFLREIAVKERAAETAAAIDGILLDRQERFKNVITELERNNERLRRLLEREERRNQQRERERSNGRTRERPERPERSRKDAQQ